MGINPNDILLKTWEMLDKQTSFIMDTSLNAVPEKEIAKVKARSYAEVLATMMPPFFTEPDEIVREAVQRYKNRDNPDYETPGLGVKSLAEYDKMPYTNGTPSKSTSKLDAATRANIKKALESGLFTAQQLASSYSVSVSDIESCRTA